VKLFGDDHEFTKLIVDLNGKDPDDAFSSIPYEKVFALLALKHFITDMAGLSLPLLP
jgi:hypothetical protein